MPFLAGSSHERVQNVFRVSSAFRPKAVVVSIGYLRAFPAPIAKLHLLGVGARRLANVLQIGIERRKDCTGKLRVLTCTSDPEPLLKMGLKPPHDLDIRGNAVFHFAPAVTIVREQHVRDRDTAHFEVFDHLFGFDNRHIGVVGAVQHDGRCNDAVDAMDGWLLLQQFDLRGQQEALTQVLAVVQRGISTFVVQHSGLTVSSGPRTR